VRSSKSQSRHLLLLGFTAIMGLLVSACASRPATSPEKADTSPISLVFMGDATGPLTPYSSASLQGAQMAVDEINKAGGVKGRQLVLKSFDEKNDPVEAVNIAKRVMDEAMAVIIGSGSSPALAAAPTLDKAGVPFVVTVASNPKLTESGYANVLRLHLSDRDQVNKLMEYAVKEQKFTKIAILYDTSDLGVGGKQMAEAALEKLGLKPVAVEGWKQTDADFSSQILKVKEAGAQGVLLWGVLDGAARIAVQMRKLGLENVQVYGGGGFVSQKFIDLGGSAVEGVICTWAYLEPAQSRTADFARNFEAKYNRKVDVFSAQGYDAVYLLKQGIEKAGGDLKNRAGLAKAVKESTFDGVIGQVKFEPSGHNIREIYMATVKDAKFVLKQK